MSLLSNGKFHLEQLLRSRLRHQLVLAADGVIAGGSLWLALHLRFEGEVPLAYARAGLQATAVLVAARVLAVAVFRAHRWSFRLSGLADGIRVAKAGAVGTLLFLAGLYVLQIKVPPRSVVVLELLMSLAAMAAVRFSPRYASVALLDWQRGRHNGGPLRTVIVGAGATGEALLRDLQRSDEHNYRIVAFVDDDVSKHGVLVGDRPVLGSIDDLPRIIAEQRIGKVLIAIPRLSASRIRHILEICSNLNVRFKILPVSFVYLEEHVRATMLQDLSPEDLLPREAVRFADNERPIDLASRTALVTGGAGSIGSGICEQLLRGGLGRLVMVDINENNLYLLQRRLEKARADATVVAEVADVRDRGRVQALFQRYRPHDVFHAAAHKHVPLMEAAPCEAVKNNIVATRVAAEAALACGCERFVFISTDKAVRPSSVMGASKRVGEMIVRALGQRSTTRFCAVRFGNVLGSAGSVVPIFREQLEAGGPITVTHPEVRRYFMTIGEAVGLVLKAAYGDYGELCVLDMGEQIRIVDLARHMITMSGRVPDVDVKIEFTGLRPGEKLFEELLTEEEEKTTQVAHKVFVAQSPAPPLDLFDRLGELEAAAAAEDQRQVVRLLRQLVPSYGKPMLAQVGRVVAREKKPTVA
ncbi:MAG: polysaccharide biosynthesis protein [Acidobacteriota bacterium]|jgi:FlaA1/EpsC-like NDP-sugar epimerase